jgi:P27 family predicted phage terminase small subunit
VATDASLVIDYIRTICLRDVAFDAMTKEGLFVDDAKGSIKTNPAYKIYRDASDRVLRLRSILLMTPASRIAAQNISTEDPEPEKGIAALAD